MKVDLENPVYKIAASTPYPVNEIQEFMFLTGLNIDETEKIMTNFTKCRI